MINQSPHRDVLEANPDSDDSKTRLVEELQSRGRAAVGAKSWMDAKMLYEKAIAISTSSSPPANDKMAILNSNLSLVLKNMGSSEEARHCAEAATIADPNYVKGWWRLGQALQKLHRSQEALEALTKAKSLEPSNKALVKEYEKVQKMVEEEAKLMNEMPVDEEPKPTKTTSSTTSTTTTKKPSPKTSDNGNNKMQVDDDDDDNKEEEEKIFSKSDAVRGYKVVNGKKTSYFHNELDEETKNLIGDFAPKKLETPSATATPKNNSKGGGSAWNTAGTWEEKNVTKWAKERLEQCILQTTFSLPASSPAPGALVTVSKVRTLEGHASFAMARGKKKYIYEFMVKLDWKMHDPGTTALLDCSGSLVIPDVDGTIDLGEGYEIHDFLVDSASDNSVKPLIDRFVHRGGFSEALNESIDDWVRAFKEEY
jgi:tetratricopeptide (TPR) repeat protein